MPFIAAPGVLKAEFLYHWSGGKVMANVLHLIRNSGSLSSWTPTDLNVGLANTVFDAWTSGSNNIMANRAGTLTLDRVVLTDLSSITGVQAVSTRAAFTGAASGSALPSGVCSLIKLQTATRSRHGRGRIFLPAVTVNDVDAFGALTSGYITLIVDGWTLFVAAILTASTPLEPVVLNRAAGTALAVTSFTVESIARSQRRRELDH